MTELPMTVSLVASVELINVTLPNLELETVVSEALATNIDLPKDEPEAEEVPHRGLDPLVLLLGLFILAGIESKGIKPTTMIF